MTHIIRSNTDGQKVVAVTAAPNIKAAEEFLSEFDAVIYKPIAVADFMATVKKFL